MFSQLVAACEVCQVKNRSISRTEEEKETKTRVKGSEWCADVDNAERHWHSSSSRSVKSLRAITGTYFLHVDFTNEPAVSEEGGA